MEFDEFDWDQGNWPKCASHGVTRQEIETALSASTTRFVPDRKHSGDEERYLAIASVDGHHGLLVGFTVRLRNSLKLIRPLTARYMHAREVRRYGQDQDP